MRLTPLCRLGSQESGEVELIGMLRSQERANAFTPANDIAKGEWVWSDIKQMAEYAGAEPVLVDEIFCEHPHSHPHPPQPPPRPAPPSTASRQPLTVLLSFATCSRPRRRDRQAAVRGRSGRPVGLDRAAEPAPHLRRHVVRPLGRDECHVLPPLAPAHKGRTEHGKVQGERGAVGGCHYASLLCIALLPHGH